MWFLESIPARLRTLLGARPRVEDAHASAARRDALEARLLAEHQRRYVNTSNPSSASGSRRVARAGRLALVGRLALASVALTVAGVAACQIPVDVELALGYRFVFDVPADDPARAEALGRELEATGAEGIEMRIHHDGGPTMEATMTVWGTSLDADAIAAVIAEQGLEVRGVEPLEGEVRTTWGDRIGHDLFDLELDLDAMDVDEARRAILDQLAAQGFAGEAEVHVEDQDGHRRVEIRLRESEIDGHTPPPSP